MNNVNMNQHIIEAAVLSETNNNTDVLSVTFAHFSLWYDVAWQKQRGQSKQSRWKVLNCENINIYSLFILRLYVLTSGTHLHLSSLCHKFLLESQGHTAQPCGKYLSAVTKNSNHSTGVKICTLDWLVYVSLYVFCFRNSLHICFIV